MELIETVELASSASSITFSSIPQDYDDLILKFAARSAADGNPSFFGTGSINSSTANLSAVLLEGTGSSVSSSSRSDFLIRFPGSSSTANTFGNAEVYFSNYTGSTNKSFSVDLVSEDNATAARQLLSANLWSNTNAITSLTFTAGESQDFASGSTFSLYGVTSGGSGTVTTA